MCLARVQKCNKLPTIHSGEALKGTKGVNMYLDQRYYEPKDAIGRELFSAGFTIRKIDDFQGLTYSDNLSLLEVGMCFTGL